MPEKASLRREKDVDKATLSTIVKLASGDRRLPRQRVGLQAKAGYGQLSPTHCGAEDTQARVISGMRVTDDVFPRQQVVAGGCSLGLARPVQKAGFLMKSMRFIPSEHGCAGLRQSQIAASSHVK